MPSTHSSEEEKNPAIAVVLGVVFFVLPAVFLPSII
jgi:hypothetical protein